jgi:hypothetical protein
MQAERAPFVGIVLALLFVAVETVGLLAYARTSAPPVASLGKAQTWSAPPVKLSKPRCRR